MTCVGNQYLQLKASPNQRKEAEQKEEFLKEAGGDKQQQGEEDEDEPEVPEGDQALLSPEELMEKIEEQPQAAAEEPQHLQIRRRSPQR